MNVVDAKAVAAGGHGREELAELAGEAGGLGSVQFNHLAEEVVRQKANAIGKEAEEQPHKEVGHGLRVRSGLFQADGELGKLRGRRFRDAGGGVLRAELLGIGEGVFQDFQRRNSASGRGRIGKQIVQGEAVDVRAGSGEVGMDLKTLQVTDHQQGRILQVFPVIIELEIRRIQVFVLALVLPCEE